jgi:hypothetical protein
MNVLEMLTTAMMIETVGKKYPPITLRNGLSLSVRPMTIQDITSISAADPELVPLLFIALYMRIEGKSVTRRQIEGMSVEDMRRLGYYALSYLEAVIATVSDKE